jgi:hypothetical protein
MNTTNKSMTLAEFSRRGNEARWKGKTDEEKRKAVSNAVKARKAAAKARREAKAAESR